MKFIKVLKAKENEEVVKQRLEELAHLLDEEGSISYGEINYLQDHQEEIKKYFPNNSIMWQWADIPEEEWRNKKSSKNIKSGESYGWVVNPDDAWDKLQLWIDTVGAEAALDDIAKAMGTEELSSCLAFIFRNNDFKEGCSDFESEDEENSEDK